MIQLEKLCAKTALRRVDNQNLTFDISAYDMAILDSIFKTIESIKKRYPFFKIKVASVELYKIYEDENEKLAELLSTYKVAELKIFKERYRVIKGVP